MFKSRNDYYGSLLFFAASLRCNSFFRFHHPEIERARGVVSGGHSSKDARRMHPAD